MPLRRAATSGVLVAALLSSLPGFALDPKRALTQYVHDVWRAPASIPHDNVAAIAQDREGYLWVGTVEGLARFDGARSVVFHRKNTPEIGDNWVKALLADRSGRLWIGTYAGGLTCRDDGGFRRYGADQGLPSDVLFALAEDRSGSVWVGANDGLYRFDGSHFARQELTSDETQRSVRAILEDRTGTLWAGTTDGLYRRRAGGWDRVAGLSNEVVLALAETGEGLFVGTEKGGLDQLAGDRIRSWSTSQGLAHERVWALTGDRDGNLWIGTDGGGLQRLRDGRLDTLTAGDGLVNDYVWALHEDREGSLWVGTNGGGLHRFGDGRAVAWTTREGLPSDFVWAVLRTRSGELFVGTEDAGLARQGALGWQSYAVGAPGPGSAKVLFERRDGSLWIGGHRGVWRWHRDAVVPAGLPQLGDATINAFAESDDGTLWIATNSAGVYGLKTATLEPLELAGGVGARSATALLVDHDDALWIGSLDGVVRRQGAQIERWTADDGLPSSYVTDLLEAPDGSIWAATRGGLAHIRQDRAEAVTEAHGLFDGAVMSAALDRSGGVWLGGNRGLGRVSLEQLEEVLAGARRTVEPLALALDDGLPSLEINGAGSSSFEDPDGRLWFATRGGLVRVDPELTASSPAPPPVVVEEVLADGVPLAGHGPWVLPPGLRRLQIHFTALTFASISRTRLRHRLDGFDSDWVESRRDRTAEYTNLPHGRYRFRVAATDRDGRWAAEEATIELQIEPRPWETLWFRALAVVVFVLLGPLSYLLRVRQLRAQKIELERVVAARTAEVQAANVNLSQLAREDPLTRLANRRSFDEVLDGEWRRAARLQTPLALLMIDVDFFKDYNDQAGHLAGDACLRTVAQALTHTFQRAGELVARVGGEEFAALLPSLTREQASAVAEEARQRVLHLELPHPTSSVVPVVSVSIGLAWTVPSLAGAPIELVGAADRALYRAKQNGRNRVETATDTTDG